MQFGSARDELDDSDSAFAASGVANISKEVTVMTIDIFISMNHVYLLCSLSFSLGQQLLTEKIQR